MNKFVAILRDSYREAVSTWVIQVMLVLCVLLVLFIASIGFRPITLQDELENNFSQLNFVLGLNPAAGKPAFVVENMEASKPDEPWNSDYRFDIVFRGGKPEFVRQLSADPSFPLTRSRVERFVSNLAPYLDDVKVAEVASGTALAAAAGGPAVGAQQATGAEYRFRVTTKGTKIKDRESWVHQPSFLFAFDYFFTYSLRDGVYKLEKRLVNDAGSWVTLLVSVVITAGFIPNLLRKGALDLYIAKPIGRVALLVYKYIGGLLFVLILTTVMVGGVWVAIGLRTGFWTPHFLGLIPLLTFYFAILYAVSTLAAVLTRSTLVAILATIVAWAVFFGIGAGYDLLRKAKATEKQVQDAIGQVKKDADPDDDPFPPTDGPPEKRQPWQVPRWLDITSKVLYYPSPRTYDLDDRMIQLIAQGVLTEFELKQNDLDRELPPWWETIGVSLAFIVVCLALASWRLVTRDG